MFKIIGIRIHEGCEPNIRKILKEEKSYFIYNNYEDEYSKSPNAEGLKWIGIKHRNDTTETVPPEDFYCLQDKTDCPKISVSSIVGKNGSGKSALIEIVIRILNNFAIEAGFIENQSSLIKVKGLKATLFYSIDETIYYIECDGEICTWRKGNTTIDIQKTNAKRTLLSHSNEVFYTIITNYSMFAYNSLNFQNEDVGVQEDGESWIASLFHKNDSYQTPVVLNPMRTKGNFDVNKEKDLTTQRLLALFTDAGNEKLFMAQNALGYVYSMEKESKLLSVSIDTFYKKTNQKKVFHFGSFSSDFNNDFDTVPNFHYQLRVWIKYEGIIRNNLDFFKAVNKRIQLIEKDSSLIEYESDLKLLFSRTIRYVEKNKELPNTTNEESLIALSTLKELSAFFNTNCPKINFLVLQRLLMIVDLWNCWKTAGLIDNDLLISDAIESPNYRHKAMLYLVYKTISIFETYRDRYYFNSTITENNAYLLDPANEFFLKDNRLIIEFNTLYKNLNKDKSFDTLKLRQTINYLSHDTTDTTGKRQLYGYDYYMSFKQLLQKTKKIKRKDSSLKTIELLPPPIFVGDILFSTNSAFNQFQSLNPKELNKVLNGKMDDIFTLKAKSSGEQQLLFSIGTLIYHLRNLNSSTNQNGNITYSNVSIILDEVELYFHPEYQRKYVDYLLESIAHAGLDRIKNINICCITHSPFILSDIPKNNVLFLDNGNSVRTMQEDTFGANIHTILQNGFFLESLPIGEFAKKKINELFELLHRNIIEIDTYNLIQLVSEPVLKSQLLRLYHQLSPDNNQKIDELKKEIELLKEEIKELKTNQ